MSAKTKDKPKPITVVTLRLSEDTGAVGYKATIAVMRGEWGHVGQFEYFEAKHMTEAIEQALTKLAAIERQPPQFAATTEVAVEADNLADEAEDEPDWEETDEEIEAPDEPDPATTEPTEEAAQTGQPGLI